MPMFGLSARHVVASIMLAAGSVSSPASASEKPDFPKFEDVSKGYERVGSPEGSLYTLFVREKDGQMLAELPAGWSNQKHFFAMTVGKGELYAGLQGADLYTYWRRYDDRMALMAPQVSTRSTGDQESKDGVDNIFTDRVLVDVPIVAIGPSGQPVIDLDALLAGQASRFFGGSARGANTRLLEITKAKSFPQNLEIAIEMPTSGGVLKEFHYSISNVKGSPDYKPRKADQRIGNFTTTFRDLGKFEDDEVVVRYVNRWNVQKRDPSLKLSPAKKPIVFYIEHTTPVRYRRFIKEGAEYWNKAFAESAGILNAIEIYQQDASTGAHMEKDPEDVRYNFIRWLANDIGTAIGPSRPHPETGEILDADVVLTDGWIRYFNYQYNDLLPDIATEGFDIQTMNWLSGRPQYDPRVLLADPAERDAVAEEIAQRGILRYGGKAHNTNEPNLYGDEEFDGLANVQSQFNGYCLASQGKAMDLAMMAMHMSVASDLVLEEHAEKNKNADLIDGMPDWFVGPMLADLVAHEVGHTLGFSHNFKASSMYTHEEINSKEVKGTPFTASVMDYIPININMGSGEIQGDYAMVDIGKYDHWVVEYTYGNDPEKAIVRGAVENIPYANDMDASGIDPLARRYDFAKWPLDYVNNQMRIVDYYRDRLLDGFVEDGESWAKARWGFNVTLGQQMGAVSIMANWIGGAYIERDRKGQEGARTPLTVVEVDKQRAALDFVLETGMREEAYGLDPEIMGYLVNDLWWDRWASRASREFAVHDRINAMMASSLTLVMNPTTLGRVYDNEFRVPNGEDAITLPEVMTKTIDEVFSEIEATPRGNYTAREPMISSFRRNLQLGLVDRLIDFTKPGAMRGAAAAPVRTLSTHYLREIQSKVDSALESRATLDPYTSAHLSETSSRIDRALEAEYIYNAADIAPTIRFGREIPNAE